VADDYVVMKIRRRRWWVWLLAVIVLVVEVVLIQTAAASSWEHEPRAAAISWTLAALLAAVGLRLWFRSGQVE
jgi:hypothetical protein